MVTSRGNISSPASNRKTPAILRTSPMQIPHIPHTYPEWTHIVQNQAQTPPAYCQPNQHREHINDHQMSSKENSAITLNWPLQTFWKNSILSRIEHKMQFSNASRTENTEIQETSNKKPSDNQRDQKKTKAHLKCYVEQSHPVQCQRVHHTTFKMTPTWPDPRNHKHI